MDEFENPDSWLLEDCFKMLVCEESALNVKDFDGCDMDVKDNFDETLLIHTIKEFKNRSLEILLKQGVNVDMPNALGIKPLG